MNIVLVAEEAAGVQALRWLANTEHHVTSVFTSSRSGNRGAAVAEVATQLGIDVVSAKCVRERETAAALREKRVDLLLNVHSLFVLHPAVVRAARIGSFNLHPGPLPRYAGLNAPSWAVYNGETSHAVTLHWMNEQIDGGAIAYDAAFAIDIGETGLSLSTKCVRLGIGLLRQLVMSAGADPDTIPVRAQDMTLRQYHGSEVPNAGVIDWSRSADEVTRFLRACDFGPLPSPWGMPRTWLGNRPLSIVAASRTGQMCPEPPGTIGRTADGWPTIATADEWVRVDRARAEGRPVDARDVLVLGQRLEETGPRSAR